MSKLVPWIIDTEQNLHWHYWNLTFLICKMIDTFRCWYLGLLALAFFILGIFIFSMSDTEHDSYMTWLTLTYLICIWNFWYWTFSKIGGGCHHLLLIYDALILSSAVYVVKSPVLCLQRAFFQKNLRFNCAKINNDKYELFWVSIWSNIKYA